MRQGPIVGMHRFLAGWRFPTVVLSIILAFYTMVVGLVFWPPGSGALAAFATEFRTWCLATDPSSGDPSRLALLGLLSEPIALGLLVLLLWWEPLAEVRERPRKALPYATAALVFSAVAMIAMNKLAEARPTGWAAAEFPADRMRTAVPPPDIELVDHEGAPVRLDELRGQVVLVTAVYASCGLACPMIFAQVRRVLETLTPEERAQVVVLAITLDPEHDDVEHLAALAAAQKVATPTFHLLTGAPAGVDAVLDGLGVERHRNPETGQIEHSNLFAAIDRKGTIAYRFTLGSLQEGWTVAALRQLVAEPRPARR